MLGAQVGGEAGRIPSPPPLAAKLQLSLRLPRLGGLSHKGGGFSGAGQPRGTLGSPAPFWSMDFATWTQRGSMQTRGFHGV